VLTDAIAEIVGGEHRGAVCDVIAVAELPDAGPSDLAYLRRADELSLPQTQAGDILTAAGCVIVSPSAPPLGATVIVAANPRLAFAVACDALHPRQSREPGIHPAACVRGDCDPTATIGPFVSVPRGARVCAHAVLEAGAILYPGAYIGPRTTVHSGAIIGARGFNAETAPDGTRIPMRSLGGVHVGADCEIGAGTTIDAGSIRATWISDNVLIDDQCHVGHDVRLGRHVLIAANSLVGGYVEIGESAYVAPSATVRNRVRIGARAFVGMGSLVTRDVAEGARVAGSPARPLDALKRMLAAWRLL